MSLVKEIWLASATEEEAFQKFDDMDLHDGDIELELGLDIANKYVKWDFQRCKIRG